MFVSQSTQRHSIFVRFDSSASRKVYGEARRRHGAPRHGNTTDARRRGDVTAGRRHPVGSAEGRRGRRGRGAHAASARPDPAVFREILTNDIFVTSPLEGPETCTPLIALLMNALATGERAPRSHSCPANGRRRFKSNCQSSPL